MECLPFGEEEKTVQGVPSAAYLIEYQDTLAAPSAKVRSRARGGECDCTRKAVKDLTSMKI